jgi:hypothetical protein
MIPHTLPLSGDARTHQAEVFLCVFEERRESSVGTMFGLFRRSISQRKLATVTILAQEAYVQFPGLIQDDFLVHDYFMIQLTEPDERGKLFKAVRNITRRLPTNPMRWRNQLRRMTKEMAYSPSSLNSKYNAAAFDIVACMMKVNTCCKIALSYPGDKYLSDNVLKLATACIQASDLAASGTNAPSRELLYALPHLRKFINRKCDIPKDWG